MLFLARKLAGRRRVTQGRSPQEPGWRSPEQAARPVGQQGSASVTSVRSPVKGKNACRERRLPGSGWMRSRPARARKAVREPADRLRKFPRHSKKRKCHESNFYTLRRAGCSGRPGGSGKESRRRDGHVPGAPQRRGGVRGGSLGTTAPWLKGQARSRPTGCPKPRLERRAHMPRARALKTCRLSPVPLTDRL